MELAWTSVRRYFKQITHRFSHTQVVVPAGHDQDSLPGASWEQGLLKS